MSDKLKIEILNLTLCLTSISLILCILLRGVVSEVEEMTIMVNMAIMLFTIIYNNPYGVIMAVAIPPVLYTLMNGQFNELLVFNSLQFVLCYTLTKAFRNSIIKYTLKGDCLCVLVIHIFICIFSQSVVYSMGLFMQMNVFSFDMLFVIIKYAIRSVILMALHMCTINKVVMDYIQKQEFNK